MKITPAVRARFLALALAAGLSAAALAQTSRTLSYKGIVVSRDLLVVNGRPYVAVADVAKMLGGTTLRNAGGYEIKERIKAADEAVATPDAPGGTNQVEGRRGKVGDVLFDGRWRFQVMGVTTAALYTEQYAPDPQPVEPAGTGDKLVIIRCEAKNGTPKNQGLGFFPQYAHTALTDDQGNSYPPLDADIRSAPHLRGLVTTDLLPGAKTNFALVFSLPQNAGPRDLVFTLTNSVGEPKSDVRVSLTP